jgi:hypothetical protein
MGRCWVYILRGGAGAPFVCTKRHLTTFRSAIKHGADPEEGTTNIRGHLKPAGGNNWRSGLLDRAIWDEREEHETSGVLAREDGESNHGGVACLTKA